MKDLAKAFAASILFIFVMCAIAACTYSVNMVLNHGTASDVVDETQSPSNDVKPNIQLTPNL